MLQLIFTCFPTAGTQRTPVRFRTALGKSPGPCCPQWAEAGSRDGLGRLCAGGWQRKRVSVAGHTG